MTTTRPTPPIEFSTDIGQITDRFQTTATPLSESLIADLKKYAQHPAILPIVSSIHAIGGR